MNLIHLAADGEGSPVGDAIRQNETLAGFVCIGVVLLAIVILSGFTKK